MSYGCISIEYQKEARMYAIRAVVSLLPLVVILLALLAGPALPQSAAPRVYDKYGSSLGQIH